MYKSLLISVSNMSPMNSYMYVDMTIDIKSMGLCLYYNNKNGRHFAYDVLNAFSLIQFINLD